MLCQLLLLALFDQHASKSLVHTLLEDHVR